MFIEAYEVPVRMDVCRAVVMAVIVFMVTVMMIMFLFVLMFAHFAILLYSDIVFYVGIRFEVEQLEYLVTNAEEISAGAVTIM